MQAATRIPVDVASHTDVRVDGNTLRYTNEINISGLAAGRYTVFVYAVAANSVPGQGDCNRWWLAHN